MRKSLFTVALVVTLSSCASLESGRISSPEDDRLMDVASNTERMIDEKEGVRVRVSATSDFVISDDSRYVLLGENGTIFDIKSRHFLVPTSSVLARAPRDSVTGALDSLPRVLREALYVKLDARDAPSVSLAVSRVSSILPMIRLLRSSRCTEEVSLSVRDDLEVFRVSLDPDCVPNALGVSVDYFVDFISEDFSVFVKDGSVSALGPTGGSPVVIDGFEPAINSLWDGSYVEMSVLMDAIHS